METFGKRWQLRLLAGLLAVFVTLYFTADLFGGVRADDSSATIGESSELDEDTVDDEEEESAEEIMLFALDRAGGVQSMTNPPFEITDFTVTINGSTLTPGVEQTVSAGDSFSLKFKWQMLDNQPHRFETFSYDLTNLNGIKLNDSTLYVDYTGDGVNDAYYEVKDNVLTLYILETRNFKNYTGGFTITGNVDLNRAPQNDDGKFTLTFANKTFNLIRSDVFANLAVAKTAVGEPKLENGSYWQTFTITVKNNADTEAQNVTLKDEFGALFDPNSVVVTGTNGVTATGFPVTIPTIGAKQSVGITYKVKLKPDQILGGQNNNSNRAEATAKNQTYPSSGWASVSRLPSFRKTGSYDENTETIEWRITVYPGFIHDNEEWTVTDKGQMWTKSQIMNGADGWTKNGDTYTLTLTESAPAADYDRPASNSAAFNAPDSGVTKTETAKVTIPAKNILTKEHGNATPSGSTVSVPWSISIKLPGKAAADGKFPDLNAEIAEVVVSDSLADMHLYAGQNNRIENQYASLTITDAAGKVYKPGTMDGNSCTIPGVGKMDKTYYAENVQFKLIINDPQFLNTNAGQSITISYPLDIKSTAISEVTNHVTVTVRAKHDDPNDPTKKVTEDLLTRTDDATYQRDFIVKKDENTSGAHWAYGRNAHSWKVTLINNAGVNADIVFEDRLPTGYELCTKSGGGYEMQLADASGSSIPYTVTVTERGTGSNKVQTFTVKVDKRYSDRKTLTLNYTANMTTDHYNSLPTAQANQGVTYTYTNTIKATSGSESATDTDTFYINAPTSSPPLKKEILEQESTDTGFAASYLVRINPDAEDLKVSPLTLTDKLGTYMELDESSVRIVKLTGDNEWIASNWTSVSKADAGYRYDPVEKTITLNKLQNAAYYQLRYEVTGKGIRDNELTDTSVPGVQDELNNRFGNTVKLQGGTQTFGSSSVMLSRDTYRQDGYVNMFLDLHGTKQWNNTGKPASTAQPNAVTLSLERTETKVDRTKEIKTFTFRLTRDTVTKIRSDADFDPPLDRDGTTPWSFRFNILPFRNSPIGSTYTYRLYEDSVTGYTASYQYKTSVMSGYAPVAVQSAGVDTDNLELRDMDDIDIIITNAYGQTAAVSEVYIEKRDMTGAELLEDAQLTITNNNGKSLSGVTVTGAKTPVTPSGTSFTFTTTNQRVTIKGLPEGDYTLTEKIAPNGYIVTTPFNFKVDKNGKVTAGTGNGSVNTVAGKTITLKDEMIRLTIRKVDSVTNRLLPGAEFTLAAALPTADLSTINIEGATINLAATTQTSFAFTTRSSDVTIEGIPAGTYTLTEEKAPNRYQGAGKITFTIDKDGKITGNANNTITVENELITANLTVKKIDGAGNVLPGAKFTLRATAAVDWTNVTFGGTPGSGNGTSYKFTVDSGNLEIKGLPIGSYTLTETEAPNDSYLLADPFRFDVTNTGTISPIGTLPATVSYASGTVTLTDQAISPGTIVVTKTDTDGTLLGGAVFELTAVSGSIGTPNAVNVTNSSVSGNTLTFTTVAGKQAKISDLAEGKYTITETKAPSGYIRDTTVKTVDLTIAVGGNVSSASRSFLNRATSVSVNKTDLTGAKQLEGAKLTITAITGSGDFSNVSVTGADYDAPNGSSVTFTTTGETATITGLPEGDYELEEKIAPSGYTITTTFYFTIEADGSVSKTSGKNNYNNELQNGTITLKDAPTELSIKKVDMTNAKQLPGATLLIRSKGGADFTNVTVSGAASSRVNKTTSRITLVTGNTDVTIKGLPAGDYELTETLAPEGYDKTTTVFTFTIDKDGNITGSTNTTSSADKPDIRHNGTTITVENAPQKTTPTNPTNPNPGTPGGNNPGSNPGSGRPSGTTQPAGGPSVTTTVPGAAVTTVRGTTTEPDEIEPEKSSGTTAKTTEKATEKTKKTQKTTTAPESDLPKTTEAGTKRTDLEVGVNEVTRDPGSGIDSTQTVREENPNTGVPIASMSIAVIFAAAGALTIASQKKKKK